MAERKEYLEMIDMMLDLITDDERDAGIVIRFTSQFISGFSKNEFSEIKISFPDLAEPSDFGNVDPILKPYSAVKQKDFFLCFFA